MAKKAKKTRKRAREAGHGLKLELLDAYRRMLFYQFVGTVGLAVLFTMGLVLFYYKYQAVKPPLLIIIMLTGMLGAFFSALTRLYNVDDVSIAVISPTVSRLGGRYLLIYSFVPEVVGAIASVVLYVTFVAGLLKGGLFPNIDCEQGTCATFADLLTYYGPVGPADYGKALFWAFAAGFSERLVPDTLQSLVKQSVQEKKK